MSGLCRCRFGRFVSDCRMVELTRPPLETSRLMAVTAASMLDHPLSRPSRTCLTHQEDSSAPLHRIQMIGPESVNVRNIDLN